MRDVLFHDFVTFSLKKKPPLLAERILPLQRLGLSPACLSVPLGRFSEILHLMVCFHFVILRSGPHCVSALPLMSGVIFHCVYLLYFVYFSSVDGYLSISTICPNVCVVLKD